MDEFQTLLLERLRAVHKADVLEPLNKGVINDEIGAIIEKEAGQIISALK